MAVRRSLHSSFIPRRERRAYSDSLPEEYWHDGARLESGVKYLLRTDVMYARPKAEPKRQPVEVIEI